MFHTEHGVNTTMFEINNTPNTVVKTEPKTSRATPKTSAYDRVVQLVANYNAEPVSQQQEEPQTKEVHIIV